MSTEELLFAASLSSTLPSVDLHVANDVHEALSMTEQFLYKCHKSNVRYGRIVHGHGTGVLSSAVATELNGHPIVRAWQREDHGGSCIVVF